MSCVIQKCIDIDGADGNPIYGSSRIGVLNSHINVSSCTYATNISTTATFTAGQEVEYNPVLSIEGWGQVVNPFNPPRVQFSRTLGNKAYELTDHLGNVAVTLSDRKIAVKPVNGLVQYYFAEVKSSNDYYPGGMEIMERSGQSSKYNFGYQGSLKDYDINDVNNAYFSTFYREGNTQSLNWFIPDPESAKTPWESTYSFMGGNPIWHNDPLGNSDSKPDDFVIATGETHSVREFLEEAFSYAGLDWKKYVEIDKRYFRPAEVDLLIGDATKAKEKLKWVAKTNFKELVKIMVDADLKTVGVK